MPVVKITKVYPDGTREELEEIKKPTPRRKSRASTNNKKKQKQFSVEEVKAEDS